MWLKYKLTYTISTSGNVSCSHNKTIDYGKWQWTYSNLSLLTLCEHISLSQLIPPRSEYYNTWNTNRKYMPTRGMVAYVYNTYICMFFMIFDHFFMQYSQQGVMRTTSDNTHVNAYKMGKIYSNCIWGLHLGFAKFNMLCLIPFTDSLS